MKNTFLIMAVFFSLALFAQDKVEVYFAFNSDVPTVDSMDALKSWMNANPDSEIRELKGYCDTTDAKSYNRDLAARRIKSVLEVLKSNQIAVAQNLRLEPIGEDFNQSVNVGQNRRVDIVATNKLKANSDLLESGNKLSAEVKTQILTAKKGDLIQIHNINFHLNSEKIIRESRSVLEDLYLTMFENPQLKIKIHGHICCNPDLNDTSLSYRRAKFIFTYLLEKGIALSRLGYKGFGSARPIYPIPEQNPEEAEANRRVEIEITQNR